MPLSTPAARILIHHGSAACLAAARAAPPPPLPAGAAYFEPVEALAGQGLLLSGSGACLRLGDSPQVGGLGCMRMRWLDEDLGQPPSWACTVRSPVLPACVSHSLPAATPPRPVGTLCSLAQDVVSELGQPSSMHIKPGRQGPAGLAAPLQPGTAGSAPGPLDYFYCFAERGIDVLFCGSSHRLKKLVLHANAPGHPDFGLYRKCNFRQVP